MNQTDIARWTKSIRDADDFGLSTDSEWVESEIAALNEELRDWKLKLEIVRAEWARRKPLVRRCAWCQRVMIDGVWQKDVPLPKWTPFTDGMCEPCSDKMLAKAKEDSHA